MALDLADIQGNLLQGYRSENARHFALGIGNAQGGAAFIGDLVSGDETRSPQITTAELWPPGQKPSYRLNIGITCGGLEALGVPDGTLAAFPAAFREGAAQRALDPDPDYAKGANLGDNLASSPANWILGGTQDPPVHVVLSLYTDDAQHLDELSTKLRALFAANGLNEIAAHDANALPGGRVHFGYRDGIAQPQIAGATPEVDVKLGAGSGVVGEVINLPVGSGNVAGHKIVAEWLIPAGYLRNEAKASPNHTIIMEVIGDSMQSTYMPGDRVIVDLSQNQMTTDTVYAISDGYSEPQIKRLQRVPFTHPSQVKIISDNPALETFTVELERLTIIGRICGHIARK